MCKSSAAYVHIARCSTKHCSCFFASKYRQLIQSTRLRGAAGELPIIELSTKARPVMHTTRGDVYHFTLPAAVAEQMRTLAREEGTTLYTVLAAAFTAFLSRSCGGLDDVIIGTPVSCRNTTQVSDVSWPGAVASHSVPRARGKERSGTDTTSQPCIQMRMQS